MAAALLKQFQEKGNFFRDRVKLVDYGTIGLELGNHKQAIRYGQKKLFDLDERLKEQESTLKRRDDNAGFFKTYKERLEMYESGQGDLDDCEIQMRDVYRHKMIESDSEWYIAPEVFQEGGYKKYNMKTLRAIGGIIFGSTESNYNKPRNDDEMEAFTTERESVPKKQLLERIEAFGALGQSMHKALLKRGIVSRVVGLMQQRTEVEKLSQIDGYLAASYSLLYAEIPIQTGGSEKLLEHMAKEAYSLDEMKPKYLNLDSEEKEKIFKLKKHSASENKTNVYFGEVWEAAKSMSDVSRKEIEKFAGHMHGMTNDQAAGCIMYWVALRNVEMCNAEKIAISAVKNPEQAGCLSTAIKSLGLQWRCFGALLIEAGSLQGRGVNDIDLKEIMKGRVGPAGKEMTLNVNQEQLFIEVQKILDEEMNMDAYRYEHPERFWTRRWEWGVNGAHSRTLQGKEPKFKVEPEDLKRLHRRVYLEEVTCSPMDNWSGKTYVSCIKKIENEKVRDLQAVDSNTYIAFEHMLQGVEKCWKGKKVILNPGDGGTMKMADRIRAMKKKVEGGYNVMIDYAKYNTQHSIESQKTVISAVCEKIGYPAGMAKKLVESLGNMELYCDGEYLGVAGGTLMSGHRVTTFINSVLNLAYLRVFCPAINGTLSMHVGDDVYVATGDLKTASNLVMQVKVSPIRAKQEKQSMGEWSSEFLRMCTRGEVTRGYLCRSISTCIMGNWVNDVRMEPEEGLKTMVAAAWTISNRAQWKEYGRILVPSVMRISGLGAYDTLKLVTGAAGLNDGPQRKVGFTKEYIRIEEKKIRKRNKKTEYAAMATRDFLREHCTELERELLTMANVGLVNVMKEASYRKSERDVANERESSEISMSVVRRIKGCYSHNKLRLVKYRKPLRGALESYTLLALFKNQITGVVMDYALEEAGVMLTGMETTAEKYMLAWGTRYEGIVVEGWIPYTDAAKLNSVCEKDILYVGDEYYFV